MKRSKNDLFSFSRVSTGPSRFPRFCTCTPSVTDSLQLQHASTQQDFAVMRVVAGADNEIWKREYARAESRIKCREWETRPAAGGNRCSEVEWRSKYRFSKPTTPRNISDTGPEQQIEQCATKFVP